MATKGTPLGIGLGIDFAQLDSDLSKVADRIEKIGKNVTVNVGTLAGLRDTSAIDLMSQKVSRIGVDMSRGISTGVSVSNALMLGFASRINSQLERLTGTTVTMFKRIDASMKFPMWDTALAKAESGFSHFFRTGKVGMSDLDKALGGGFGKIAQSAAKIMVPLFKQLGEQMGSEIIKGIEKLIPEVQKTADTISGSMTQAAGSMATSMGEMVDLISKKFKGLGKIIQESFPIEGVARGVYQKFGKFPEEKRRAKIAGFPSDVGATAAAQAAMFEPLSRKAEFKGAKPGPQMGKIAVDIFKDAIAGAQKFAKAISDAGGPIKYINQQFGLLGRAITIPIQATGLFVRGLAGAAAGAVGLVRAYKTFQNVVSSLGSIHKQTYSSIFRDHSVFVAGVMASAKTVSHLVRGLYDLVTLRAFRRVGQDATNAGNSIKTTTGLIGKMGSSIGRLGVEMAAAFGVVGIMYKVVQFFTQGTKAAAELNTEAERSKVVFGESYGDVAKQAEKFTRSAGVSKKAQLELASGFGSMAQGAGVSEKKSADLANELTDLAVNLTALGIPIEESSEALKSGLAGRAISLRQFGVTIDEATTKSYAWRNGIARTGSELNSQQTIMARTGMIMQGLSYAQGALERGTNLASVQFQRAGGTLAVFGERIGELLLPALQEGATGFTQLMGAILDVTEGSLATIQSWGNTIKEAFSVLGVAVRNAGDLWKIAQLHVNDFVINTINMIGTIPENAQRIWTWLGNNWSNLLTDMWNLVKTFVSNVVGYFQQLGQAIWTYLQGGEFQFDWSSIAKGFEATTEQLPELLKPAIVSSQAEIDKLYQGIGEKDQKIKDAMGKGLPAPAKPVITPETKTSEYKLGGALEAGSKEAFSAIAKGQSGRGSTTDAVKQGVAVQKDIHKAINQQTEVIKQHGMRPPLIEVK